MKCSKCGFVSHDYLDKCKKCHAPLKAKPIYKFLYESESNNQNSDFTKAIDIGLESKESGGNIIGFKPPKQEPPELENKKVELDEVEIEQVILNEADDSISSERFSIFDAPTLIENLPDEDDEVNEDEFNLDIEKIENISDDFDLDNQALEDYDYPLPRRSSKIKGVSGFFHSIYYFITKKRNYSFRDLYNQQTVFGDYVPASIESRFLASLIDIFILFLITTVTFVFGVRLIGISPEFDTNVISVLIWLYVSLFLLCSTCFIFFVYYSGQTIGKMVMNIKVIHEDGEDVGFFQSLLRWFCYVVSILPLCLGLFWIIFDVKNQSFHDKIAKTVVVRL